VPGATLLASTDRYAQQAFRLGSSYGLQFHLELSADALDSWFTHGAEELEAAGRDVAALRKELGKLRAAEAENAALLDRLAEHFARAAG
jgi:GMP synthase (glutamine-hydrolysing)